MKFPPSSRHLKKSSKPQPTFDIYWAEVKKDRDSRQYEALADPVFCIFPILEWSSIMFY